ncbi:MAG: hypothetical protein GEU88_19155 [Solirubrobacterales bacterium]|nr:hypothetical protein [Solirubrobacterales bacterium]
MAGDVLAAAGERCEGVPLLVPVMRGRKIVHREDRERIGARTSEHLRALPERLRLPDPGERPDPYPVELSPALAAPEPSQT